VFIAVSGNRTPSPANLQGKRDNSFVEVEIAGDRIVRLRESTRFSHEATQRITKRSKFMLRAASCGFVEKV